MPRHKKSSKGHSWYSGKHYTSSIPTTPSSQQSQTEKEQEQRTRACFQISNDSTVGDDESIWDEGDQPTTSYNIARKLSSVEEDVCYKLRTANKGDGIDYNALEEYTTEEKTSAKKDEGNYHLLPSSMMLSRIRTEDMLGASKVTAESLPDGKLFAGWTYE
ncbi:hypothetical protein GLOIN_2v1782267 [Rhizophagus irregularis DAOM 181602=DAOM 197198]|uniref:Uncharacterized protein n=1 Tax=Rhizophagus irregularis (strain DAOM 181602 / DAOM 197198 / MUCL 43194) TaxID=747089 RepID=A0A2P4PHX0_RHIID|nr:hypothetical protein GLOIN_2v1782267 [Rhizophagus irregularis DAOM 181602=DAOM 197198]POG64989.1 hypothetical protein GLOIN_2v1782267 [Rhizophagus irregularis DAOM 181602=DAOM 197198]|eukprot:XP_025171855.1 hypothetical protein GLOIN_2v1782267 [Rhizophagus irregularis DAOM 181602=DAOM 197198]